MPTSFIYMDVYRCAKIARVAVESYIQHYKAAKIYLYGVSEDFKWFEDLNSHGNVVCVDISNDFLLLKRWNIHGHWGTAHLWAKLIKERNEDFLIHLDSDIVFRGAALDPIFKQIEAGFDLIGSSRNYKNNFNKRDDVRHLSDLVQTAIFAFNRHKISEHPFEELVQMCRGNYNPLGHPVIDFFDPVMFEMIKNGAKVFYLEIEEYGGTHRDGHRNNKYGELNKYFDIGDLFLHFASVGSGMKYFYDPFTRFFTSDSYVQHGVERYWLFCRVFYQQNLPIEHLGKAEKIYQNYYTEIARGVSLDQIIKGINFDLLDKSYVISKLKYPGLAFSVSKEFILKVIKRLKKYL
jgi:hypothetical protein